MARIIFMPKRKTLLRLTISFVVLVLSIVSLTIFFLYTTIKSEISEQVFRRARDAAVIAARLAEQANVRWDWRNFQNTRSYKTLFSQYYDVLEAMGLENLYIVDRNMKCFLIVKGPPIQTAEEHIRILDEELARIFRGEVLLSNLYPREGGQLVSAYAPIFDKKGQVRFVVGADLDVVSGLSLILEAQNNALTIFGITVAASLLMSMILSYTIVTPIKNMVVAAEQIGLGNFDLEVPVSGRDELGFLGQTMNDMVQDIRQRDEQINKLTKGIIDDLIIYNQLILEGMLNGVLTFDLRGRLKSVNPAACKIIGCRPGELEEKEIGEIEALQGPLIEKVREAIRSNTWFQNFQVKLEKGGKEVLVSTDIMPLLDREKKTIGHMLFLDDVTEIRKLETQIKLQEKLAAIGELSAGIAHEIRNPLNSIELFLGLLQRKLKGQDQQIELTGKVRKEVQKLNKILTDFLKFARPLPLDLSVVELSRVLGDSFFSAQAEFEKRNITLIKQIPDEPMPASIDAQQIQQVFTNILLNAAQAIEMDGTIIVSVQHNSKGFWDVNFLDDGPGIPKENLDRIFNPFFTTKDEGTGLGLAMSHKIIETHGGAIHVVSGPEGTTFTVQLKAVVV